MFLSFSVQNFRSIKERVVLDFQASSDKQLQEESTFEVAERSVLKSIALYGPNASGKSNIMKAFLVFRQMITESLLRSTTDAPLPSEYFKLNVATENKPSLFELVFVLDNEVFEYGFEIDKTCIHKEWLRQVKGKKDLFVRNFQKIVPNKNYFKEAKKALQKQTNERVLFLSVLAANNGEISKKIIHFIKNANYISGTQRGGILNYTLNHLLSTPGMKEKIKKFILEAEFGVIGIEANQRMISAEQIQNIPDKFRELLFEKDSKIAEQSLKFLHKKYDKNKKEIENEPLDFFSEESEGTQQMFALSAPFIDTLENGKVLWIDEIDASLHPLLCQYLIMLFNSRKTNPKNAQLFFTTHDISLLDEKFLRRDQIYFSEKNKYGETDFFSLSDIKERKGVNFAKRYLEGRYKALPYIKTFEDLKFNRNV